MTNRQWLMWQLIDMSDEEFRRFLDYRYCIHKDTRSCPIECEADCLNGMLAWLKQEHEEG
jgi:hypothetical protein